VLAHALRYLSLLVRTDPALIAAVDEHPRLWDAVLAHAPAVAGQLVFSQNPIPVRQTRMI
jgi:hypothetical protein